MSIVSTRRRSCFAWLEAITKVTYVRIDEYQPFSVIRALYGALLMWNLDRHDPIDIAAAHVLKVAPRASFESLSRIASQTLQSVLSRRRVGGDLLAVVSSAMRLLEAWLIPPGSKCCRKNKHVNMAHVMFGNLRAIIALKKKPWCPTSRAAICSLPVAERACFDWTSDADGRQLGARSLIDRLVRSWCDSVGSTHFAYIWWSIRRPIRY